MVADEWRGSGVGMYLINMLAEDLVFGGEWKLGL